MAASISRWCSCRNLCASSKSLEGSNVNASTALVDMIDASRSWETQIKMLTTAQEMDKSSTALMQLPE